MKHVYNLSSAVRAMLSREYDNYWTATVAYESLKDYINMNFDGLKDCIVQMLTGERCLVNTETFENDMTSFRSRDATWNRDEEAVANGVQETHIRSGISSEKVFG